ncbi:hypothetical protein [Arthrobacter sp. R4-81]
MPAHPENCVVNSLGQGYVGAAGVAGPDRRVPGRKTPAGLHPLKPSKRYWLCHFPWDDDQARMERSLKEPLQFERRGNGILLHIEESGSTLLATPYVG